MGGRAKRGGEWELIQREGVADWGWVVTGGCEGGINAIGGSPADNSLIPNTLLVLVPQLGDWRKLVSPGSG